MTLTELRYIVALAQEGNFSRAAERCAVSQPTLSVAIARIEDELGVQLFERGNGFVGTSAVGFRVVEQVQRTLREAEKIRQVANCGRDQLDGPLRLGIIHTIAPYLLPQLIQALRPIAPRMPLAIEESMTARLADLLRDNATDAVIVTLPFDVPGVLTRPLYDESFKLVVPRGHPWERRESIDPAEIDAADLLLLKAGNCFRDQVLDACPQVSGAESDVRLGHSIGTIRCMVASGLGVSVLPEGALGQPYQSDLIGIVPFTPPTPSRRVALAWRAGFVRPKVIDALLAAVRALQNPAYRLLV